MLRHNKQPQGPAVDWQALYVLNHEVVSVEKPIKRCH
jgi:hypothetical protein